MDWPYEEGWAQRYDNDGVRRMFTILEFFLLRLYAAGCEDPDMEHGGCSCLNPKTKNCQPACTNNPIFVCRGEKCRLAKKSSKNSLAGMFSEPVAGICTFCIKRTRCGMRILCYSCATLKENNATEMRMDDRNTLYVTNYTLQSYRRDFLRSDLYRYLKGNSKRITQKYRDGSVEEMKVFGFMDKMIGAYRLLLVSDLNDV